MKPPVWPKPLRQGDPRQVGDFQLEGRLGSGGMGQVFLGRSPSRRPVAVKLVRPDLADDPGFRRRFAIEVEAARRVGGFYTAQVVDADTNADTPWLVTAYIPGPSLHEAVETHGPLPAESIILLGAGLAEGLRAIHACNLVHRDLKPSNVILAADGPRVIDFGIARALDATSHTLSRAVVGTPSFMSPEQARGHEVGPPGDVFSLGLVLAFAATGRSPFGTGSAEAIVYRIVHDEPDLTGLPAQLADLVKRCLAKDPGDRHTVANVLKELTNTPPPTTQWLPPPITTMIDEREVPPPTPTPTLKELHTTIATLLLAHERRIRKTTPDPPVPSGSVTLTNSRNEMIDRSSSELAKGGLMLGGPGGGLLLFPWIDKPQDMPWWAHVVMLVVTGAILGGFGGWIAGAIFGSTDQSDILTLDSKKLSVTSKARGRLTGFSVRWEVLTRLVVEGEGKDSTLRGWFHPSHEPTSEWTDRNHIQVAPDGSHQLYGPSVNPRNSTRVYADRLRDVLPRYAGHLHSASDDLSTH